MSYINVGAFVAGGRPKTKKALKEALTDAPQTVRFEGTSAMGPQFRGYARDLTEGIRLSVAGPDPYTSRKWFATVELINGKFKIS